MAQLNSVDECPLAAGDAWTTIAITLNDPSPIHVGTGAAGTGQFATDGY